MKYIDIIIKIYTHLRQVRIEKTLLKKIVRLLIVYKTSDRSLDKHLFIFIKRKLCPYSVLH